MSFPGLKIISLSGLGDRIGRQTAGVRICSMKAFSRTPKRFWGRLILLVALAVFSAGALTAQAARLSAERARESCDSRLMQN